MRQIKGIFSIIHKYIFYFIALFGIKLENIPLVYRQYII